MVAEMQRERSLRSVFEAREQRSREAAPRTADLTLSAVSWRTMTVVIVSSVQQDHSPNLSCFLVIVPNTATMDVH